MPFSPDGGLADAEDREGVSAEMCAGPPTAPSAPVGPGCDRVCLRAPSDDLSGCVPEVGLPDLCAPYGPQDCESFVCATEGPLRGLRVPLT